MSKAELQFQFIKNPAGKYGFQLVSINTGTVILPAVEWYDKEKDARAIADDIKRMAVRRWREGVIYPLTNGNYGISLYAPLEEVIKPKPVAILAALVRHNVTSKYGIAAYTESGVCVLQPEKWFDTVDGAYAHATDEEWQSKLKAAAKSLGMGEIEFTGRNLRPDKIEFPEMLAVFFGKNNTRKAFGKPNMN